MLLRFHGSLVLSHNLAYSDWYSCLKIYIWGYQVQLSLGKSVDEENAEAIKKKAISKGSLRILIIMVPTHSCMQL